ncbi:hypothetical protein Tcan_07252 [Toxocara canis]|uniref:Protein quiver n=1 Tax=Toxocara canis TaxID=6265 RepID=A0A0B2UU05_TOXCA|nr:hypothetical protein Tcan_07252 [Toxocara canis]
MQLRELRALFIGMLLALFSPLSTSIMCYKCASEAIIMNWGRYLPVLSESEGSSDRSCVIGNASIDNVLCDGPCMLLNVTFEHKSATHIIGVMRDCQTTYYSRTYSSKEAKQCKSRMVSVKGRQYNATYCFCNVDYCNGAARSQNQRLRFYGLRSLSGGVSEIAASLNFWVYLFFTSQLLLCRSVVDGEF